MKIYRKAIFVFWITTSLIFPQNYNWPCEPFNQQHWINGTFCECRSGSSGPIDHFHDAVDIHLSQGGKVYSVIDGTVTSIGWPSQYGINSWVRVGNYAYVHVNPTSGLSVGDSITAFETILGTTNEWNHIHFKDGYPGSEINALRSDGGLTPFDDPYNPQVMTIEFFRDGTNSQFTNNKVYGKIDIVSRAADVTDTGPIGGNNGIYKIGFDILDATGETVFGPTIPFKFDQIPSSDSYVTNVYAKGSNTSTYRYIVSNHITYNSSVNVKSWDQGIYTARVFTWDTRNNIDTMEVNFEVTEQDTSPPLPPTLLAVTHEENGFKIQWMPNGEDDLAGYRLYFSYDLENWNLSHNESVLTDTTTHLSVPTFPENTTIYFKLTAIDNAPFPNESNPSDIYGIRLSDFAARFLIIDGFDRTNGVWNQDTHPFAAYLGQRIGNTKMSFDTMDNDLFTIDSTFSLEEYDAIIYYSVDDSIPPPSNLLAQLPSWQDMNRGVWFIGTQLLGVLESDSLGQIYLDYVGISAGSLVTTPEYLTGANQSVFLTHVFQLNEEFYTLDSIITVVPLIPIPNLVDADGNVYGVQGYEGGRPFLFTAIPPEVLFGTQAYEDVMNEINDLMFGDLGLEPYSITPKQFQITVYPNPFNLSSQIQVTVPTVGTLKISLFSILGQLIWVEKIEVKNNTTVTVSLPKSVLRSLSSGIYFVRTELNSTSQVLSMSLTKKIVLLK